MINNNNNQHIEVYFDGRLETSLYVLLKGMSFLLFFYSVLLTFTFLLNFYSNT